MHVLLGFFLCCTWLFSKLPPHSPEGTQPQPSHPSRWPHHLRCHCVQTLHRWAWNKILEKLGWQKWFCQILRVRVSKGCSFSTEPSFVHPPMILPSPWRCQVGEVWCKPLYKDQSISKGLETEIWMWSLPHSRLLHSLEVFRFFFFPNDIPKTEHALREAVHTSAGCKLCTPWPIAVCMKELCILETLLFVPGSQQNIWERCSS